jgi:hypothetical protein
MGDDDVLKMRYLCPLLKDDHAFFAHIVLSHIAFFLLLENWTMLTYSIPIIRHAFMKKKVQSPLGSELQRPESRKQGPTFVGPICWPPLTFDSIRLEYCTIK